MDSSRFVSAPPPWVSHASAGDSCRHPRLWGPYQVWGPGTNLGAPVTLHARTNPDYRETQETTRERNSPVDRRGRRSEPAAADEPPPRTSAWIASCPFGD